MSAPGIFRPPPVVNEPVRAYAPGSPERESLRRRVEQMRGERIDVPLVIGGRDVRTGQTREHVNPKLHHLYTLNWSPDGKWFVATVHGGMGFRHTILAIEADGFGQIVDRLLVLLGDVLAFGDPEELLRQNARQRGPILLLGNSCQLLTERRERGVRHWLRQLHRNRLIGFGCGELRLLRLLWLLSNRGRRGQCDKHGGKCHNC